MASVEEIRQFLDCVLYPAQRPLEPDLRKGVHPFVTISRQTGAGGHTLAKALLEEIGRQKEPIFQGWRMFDRELCELVLKDPKLKISLDSLMREEYRDSLEDLLSQYLVGDSPQERVVKKVFEVIRTLTTFGKVVIVGRAGMCVTQGLPFGVHVRLVASEPVRVRRMMDLLHPASAEEGRKVVRRQDQDRARLVEDYFRRDIGDPLLYDAVWNTERVPMETIASTTVTLIRQRAAAAFTPFLAPGAPETIRR